MKDMTKVATTMMTDAERAEIEKELNSGGTSTPVGSATPAHLDAKPDVTASRPATPAASIPTPTSTTPPQPRPEAPPQHPAAALVVPPDTTQSPSPSPSPSPSAKQKDAAAKKRAKLTQEQKEKLRDQEEDRQKVMRERVTMLTAKMIERLRPFVEAKQPGEKDDPETMAFEKKMKREVEDLKLESFGVEVGSSAG